MINILITGAGAIGAFYGALLAKQQTRVSVVCRKDYHVVKSSGFKIHSKDLGNWQFTPDQVLRSAADYHQKADYVILCSKVLPGLNRSALIRDAVGPETAIVFIQNGVETEAEIAAAFPDNEIISGLAFICCNRTEQHGIIEHMAYGKLALGNYPTGCSDKTRLLCELFKQSGIPCEIPENIITARWQKNVWNAPFNPLSVLSGGLQTHDILNQQESLVRSVMQDICNIAYALGHTLPEDIVDFNIQSTYAIAPYKTSMLLDYEHQRPMETEAILGNAFRAAQSVNCSSPYLESLYRLMKLKETYLAQIHE